MKLLRTVIALVGVGAIGYGAVGLIGHQPVGNLVSQAIFLAAVVATHDAILLPVALAIGVATVRWTPAWLRGPVLAALYITAVLTVVALPFVIGAGRAADNPSALPLNYAHGLLIAVAVVWAAAGAVAATRWFVWTSRERRSGSNDVS